MKRIMYLSLLLVIPFFLQADHGRNRLNGKWISPHFGKQIKIKVKRNEVKVRGLSRNGWTYFTPVRRNVFEDCSGNRIKINTIHDLVYINRYRGERIRFVKRGHVHHYHNCNTGCSIGGDYFDYSGYNNGYSDSYFNDGYNRNNYYSDGYYQNEWDNRNKRGNRDRRNNANSNNSNNRFDGRYHVREIDEYVTLNKTRNGLRAKRRNKQWVEYSQNRNRKNEYVDKNGNKYLVRSDGELTWKNRDGSVSLNLKK